MSGNPNRSHWEDETELQTFEHGDVYRPLSSRSQISEAWSETRPSGEVGKSDHDRAAVDVEMNTRDDGKDGRPTSRIMNVLMSKRDCVYFSFLLVNLLCVVVRGGYDVRLTSGVFDRNMAN